MDIKEAINNGNIDDVCKSCKYLVVPWIAWHDKLNRPTHAAYGTCPLNMRRPGRGFYGKCEPGLCNSGLKYYYGNRRSETEEARVERQDSRSSE